MDLTVNCNRFVILYLILWVRWELYHRGVAREGSKGARTPSRKIFYMENLFLKFFPKFSKTNLELIHLRTFRINKK